MAYFMTLFFSFFVDLGYHFLSKSDLHFIEIECRESPKMPLIKPLLEVRRVICEGYLFSILTDNY